MRSAAAAAPARLLPVDALKALASQLIVLHHLAFYGPMADFAAPLWPALFEFLARHGRLAVQVFLVLGGYLAARSLAPDGRLVPGARPVALAWQRYLRLLPPYAVVLVLAVAASAWAGRWMTHPSIPAPPGAAQLLAHLLLLQDLLGYESLSAGLWYVAIDLQLFVLLLALLALARRLDGARRGGPWAPWAVLLGVGASLLHFNRVAGWDVAAPYFFGSYGLGVLVAWRRTRGGGFALAAAAVVVALALALDWRSRIALAAAVAALLAIWTARPAAAAIGGAAGRLAWLSRISYAVFLVHFPVCLVVNAAFVRFAPHVPAWQLAGLGVAWAASVAAGALLHRWVERPAQALRRGGPSAG